MTVPNRRIQIVNGGNGVSAGSTAEFRAKIGVASAGTVNGVSILTSPGDVASVYGTGPLVNAASHDLENGGGAVACVRARASTAGSITAGAPTVSGAQACTLSGNPLDAYNIVIEILTAGALGAAAFRYSLDAGPDDPLREKCNWSKAIAVPAGGVYAIPGTGLTATFVGTFAKGDSFPFMTDAPSFTISDLNEALDALKAASLTMADYPHWVHIVGEVTAAIAAAVDTKMSAFENAHMYTFAILEAADEDAISAVTKSGSGPNVTLTGVPSGSMACVIKITTGGALGTAKYQLSTDGGATFSSDITTLASGAQTLGTTGISATFASGAWVANDTYTFATWDKNIDAWKTALTTAYANFASDRVVVCAGFGEVALPSGKIVRGSIAWGLSAILASTGISIDAGQIQDAGNLPGFVSISHNEEASPGLDDAGFCTARTWLRIPGFYVNQPRIKSGTGSDYDLIQYRRVMDAACRALDPVLANNVNKKVFVDKTTGFILEADARVYDRLFDQPVRDATVNKGHASELIVRCKRDENILSTRRFAVQLSLIGVAYIKDLAATIGYMNPAAQPV